ncbi:MAG TPA: class I SAM-dependent methyltransferase [Marmoricola sp.]|nr:class I SAM-dependent methyltransferase [Marmoricola sp.]
MTSKERSGSAHGTDAKDYTSCYYNSADLGGYDEYRWGNPVWQRHMRMLADRVIALANPRRVLDVGCARGLWVQALRERDVEAFGIDVSEHAIESSDPVVRPYLQVRPATEPFDGKYDLIICSEVLEHMSPAEAQLAIDNMCAATDHILFSSSPADFDEPTHVNTKPTPTWAVWFAERGFFRRTDVDVTFHNPWSVYFERADLAPREIVQRYEEQYATLNEELIEKRESLLVAHRRISHLYDQKTVAERDSELLARHADLVAIDNVIGLEATVARLKNDLRHARIRIRRLNILVETRKDELEAVRSSRTWRVGRMVTRPLGKLKG